MIEPELPPPTDDHDDDRETRRPAQQQGTPTAPSPSSPPTAGRPHVTMPTPESAAFLAKKPTVPPTFDGVDYEDTTRLKQAQDAIVREQWVKVMMGRLVREELGKCYYREGVNHLEKCGHLRGQWPDHREGVRGGAMGCDGLSLSPGACPRRAQCWMLTLQQSDTSNCSRRTGSRATCLSSRTTLARTAPNRGQLVKAAN